MIEPNPSNAWRLGVEMDHGLSGYALGFFLGVDNPTEHDHILVIVCKPTEQLVSDTPVRAAVEKSNAISMFITVDPNMRDQFDIGPIDGESPEHIVDPVGQELCGSRRSDVATCGDRSCPSRSRLSGVSAAP